MSNISVSQWLPKSTAYTLIKIPFSLLFCIREICGDYNWDIIVIFFVLMSLFLIFIFFFILVWQKEEEREEEEEREMMTVVLAAAAVFAVASFSRLYLCWLEYWWFFLRIPEWRELKSTVLSWCFSLGTMLAQRYGKKLDWTHLRILTFIW